MSILRRVEVARGTESEASEAPREATARREAAEAQPIEAREVVDEVSGTGASSREEADEGVRPRRTSRGRRRSRARERRVRRVGVGMPSRADAWSWVIPWR
jgi:hypothetical protein